MCVPVVVNDDLDWIRLMVWELQSDVMAKGKSRDKKNRRTPMKP